MNNKKKKQLIETTQAGPVLNVVYNIIFIALCMMCLYPVLLLFGVSLTSEEAISEFGYKLIPQEISFDAYNYLAKNGQTVMRAYVVTIAATLTGTALNVLVNALYAYAISRNDFKYRKFFTFLQLFTMLFSGGTVPWYIICTRVLHLTNTFWALVLPMVGSAWNIIVLRTFFKTSVPDAIVESARIDGASEFTTFFKIVWPISLPGIATIALFAMLAYWNEYFNTLMLTSDGKWQNLQLYLYNILENIKALTDTSSMAYAKAGHMVDQLPTESVRMAVVIVTIGPIVLAYPFFQKYFIKGLTIGAVKG